MDVVSDGGGGRDVDVVQVSFGWGGAVVDAVIWFSIIMVLFGVGRGGTAYDTRYGLIRSFVGFVC